MLDELKHIYEDNVNWLNFAELKNGALLTIAGVFLGVINDAIDIFIIKNLMNIWCILVIMICGVSFLPFTNKSEIIKKSAYKHYIKKKEKNSIVSNNIIFYVSIFLSTKEEYKQAVKKILSLPNNYNFKRLESNYVEQIYQISAIAAIKYYFFRIAACVFAVMILFLVVVIIMINYTQVFSM